MIQKFYKTQTYMCWPRIYLNFWVYMKYLTVEFMTKIDGLTRYFEKNILFLDMLNLMEIWEKVGLYKSFTSSVS